MFPSGEPSDFLIKAIDHFPASRETSHCGEAFTISTLSIYVKCPKCGTRIKTRAFTARSELEAVFDAVFAWMLKPENWDAGMARIEELRVFLREHGEL